MKLGVLTVNLSEKGGTNRVIADLVRRLHPHHEITMFTIEGGTPGYVYPEGIPFLSLESKAATGKQRVLNTLRLVPRLAQAIREERVEAVVSFLTRANLANVLAKRLYRMSYTSVICERNFNSINYAGSTGGRLMLRLMRAVYPGADLAIANAQELAEDLHGSFGVRRDRLQVVNNPFELDHIAARAKEPVSEPWFGDEVPTFLNVARFIPQKNHALLLRAFATVRRRHKCRLAFLGEGELKPELKALGASLGVASDVHFLGWRDNPYAYMARARAFVLTSEFEGFPNVLVEAMAAGCPVISTACPSGPAEILGDSHYGLLVPVGGEAELITAMSRVLEDPGLVSTLREKSRHRAQKFAGETIAREFEQVLEAAHRRSGSL